MKKCFKCPFECELEQASQYFYRHKDKVDGFLGKCKVCTKADANKHRADNLDKVQEYDRARGQLPERIQKVKEYSKTEISKKIAKIATQEWRERNKVKYKAHSLVAKAVANGILIAQPCEVCNEDKSEAHHDDYEKPLDVRWLCSKHHKQHHREERERLRNE